MACTSQSKDEFTVKGKLDKPFTGTVYLGHITDKFTNIDSVQLTNATEFSLHNISAIRTNTASALNLIAMGMSLLRKQKDVTN